MCGAAGLAFGATVRPLAALQGPPQAGPAAAGTVKLADDLYVLSLPGEANVVAQTTASTFV